MISSQVKVIGKAQRAHLRPSKRNDNMSRCSTSYLPPGVTISPTGGWAEVSKAAGRLDGYHIPKSSTPQSVNSAHRATWGCS